MLSELDLDIDAEGPHSVFEESVHMKRAATARVQSKYWSKINEWQAARAEERESLQAMLWDSISHKG